jgi:RNA polymerase Rpb1, domain 5
MIDPLLHHSTHTTFQRCKLTKLLHLEPFTGVFGVYGIDVNPRHLSLIADFMTRTGSYLPMNRLGMNECSSPFLQMSFETTSTFLTKAASEGDLSPSFLPFLPPIFTIHSPCLSFTILSYSLRSMFITISSHFIRRC